MTPREGNLQAPTRHPVDWRAPGFYDETALNAEMERIFDICHGCRRCVSLCQAFPTLFDLVDGSKTMEVDGVAKADYVKVVDQCYLCDLCYMTKCPYVPPHPWNVDFPHVMLRAKAVKFRKGGTSFRDRLLTSTDRVGRLATIPVVVQMVNKANATPAARKVMDKVLGVAAEPRLPPYAKAPFRKSARTSIAWPVRDGARTPGKVAIFSTCYVNYNEPGIGHDLIRILAHNEIPYKIVEKEACCGMPKLELGDFETVEKLKNVNIPVLAALARDGYAIVTAVPSCTLMFKQELPLLFPEDEDVQAVADAMFDPFEYLVLRDKDGLLKKDFTRPLGNVSYHIPCHSRVQNIGQKTREVLEWIPGSRVTTVERCAGHDGTYGVKKRVLRGVDEDRQARVPAKWRRTNRTSSAPTARSPAGASCRASTSRASRSHARKEHPLTLLRMAYGL